MSLFDWIALFVFVVAWLGYGPLIRLVARRSGSLNMDMLSVRDAWMRAMTHREMRLIDSQLMGHSINSASFFAWPRSYQIQGMILSLMTRSPAG